MCVVNFTVTFQGLEDQLLVDVVKKMAPEIESKQKEIMLLINTSKNKLDMVKD